MRLAGEEKRDHVTKSERKKEERETGSDVPYSNGTCAM